MRAYPLIAWGFLASFTFGCATRADLERVRRESQELRARVADSQVALDRLSRQVSASGESEDTQRDRAAVEALARRVADLEAQLGRLRTQPSAGTVVEGAGAAATGGGLPGGVQRTQAAAIAWDREASGLQSADPQYQRALQLYREGQSEEAIRLLRDFLRQNPKSDLADNAQFWLGEAYYSRGDYNRAIIELNEVLLKHSQGDQVPGSLLALATAFANSGDKIDARLILQKLISDHGDSEEAKVGREQLKALTAN
jgi:tol-pal system protein YbgF